MPRSPDDRRMERWDDGPALDIGQRRCRRCAHVLPREPRGQRHGIVRYRCAQCGEINRFYALKRGA